MFDVIGKNENTLIDTYFAKVSLKRIVNDIMADKLVKSKVGPNGSKRPFWFQENGNIKPKSSINQLVSRPSLMHNFEKFRCKLAAIWSHWIISFRVF